MSIIKASDLTFSYPVSEDEAPELILKGINIAINKGELVAVLGHNGSGKSTFAKHLNAILLPSGGSVTVGGFDTANEDNLIAIRRKAGMVFQNPDNQLVASLVEDDVAFAPENLGIPSDEIRRRVDNAIETVGMTEYKHHEVHRLSGGQKQRVAIAGVLAMEPEILIFDEPTAMLDPQGRKEVLETILSLNREKGITVVLITHYMSEAAKCGRVIVMSDGEVMLDGTPREVFSHVEKLKAVGLSVPHPTALSYELKKEGIPMPDGILTADECVEALHKLLQNVNTPETEDNTVEAVNNNDTVIAVKNLTYIYGEKSPFEKKAVDNVSFNIKRGELIGIIGHTGSGKSTLIQTLNGLLKPNSGEIYIENENICAKKADLRKIRFKVGLCFQYPEYQLFEETVKKDIAFGPKNQGLTDEETEKRVKEASEFCAVRDNMLERSPFDLSGGQKRRVAVAGIIAMEPEILILDEPAAGLDPRARESILRRINNYRLQKNKTVLLVSHSMEDVAEYCEKIMVMNKGKLAMFDTAKNVFSRAEKLTEMGLDIPTVTKIFGKLISLGHKLNPAVYTVKQAKSELLKIFKKEGF